MIFVIFKLPKGVSQEEILEKWGEHDLTDDLPSIGKPEFIGVEIERNSFSEVNDSIIKYLEVTPELEIV